MRWITDVGLPSPLSTKEGTLSGVLLNDQDIVISVAPMDENSAIAGESWQGDWLSPMGVDLQMNGGLGLAFPDLTFEDIPILHDLLDRLWIEGVEAICPTFVSCDVLALREALAVLREVRKENSLDRCQLLGAHLEGPFISRKRKGAHLLENLCLPSLTALNERIGGFESEIALVTLAPELDGSLELIKTLRSLGIVICLGHSSADDNASKNSFDNGVSMLTHAFNAMPGLGHRSPGPIAEAIINGGIAIGLIADGVHVHPNIVVLLQQLASKQLVLVSDVIAPYGLQEGKYKWHKRWVLSDQGSCKLESGTLAGSTVSLLDSCKNLSRWSGEPSSAIWSATIAPRLVLEKAQTPKDFLLGKPLNTLLRWTMKSEYDELSWQRAA